MIRKNPNQSNVKASKISGDYDVTNIWKITPAHSKAHPAIFPQELAEKGIDIDMKQVEAAVQSAYEKSPLTPTVINKEEK